MPRKQKPRIEVEPNCLPDNGGKFHFSAKNEHQQRLWDEIHKPENEIICVLGSAGCGKSFVSMAAAVNAILRSKSRQIYISRPCVESHESLGFLPGSKEEKIQPFLRCLMDCVNTMLPQKNGELKKVLESITFEPLAFLRGVTFGPHSCHAILSEAQNCNFEQLKLFSTRIGPKCKMIIEGDPYQSDIRNSGFVPFVSMIRGVKGVKVIELPETAQVRNPLITALLNAIENNDSFERF